MKKAITCHECGKEARIETTADNMILAAIVEAQSAAGIGWRNDGARWFCPEHLPEQRGVDLGEMARARADWMAAR